MLGRKITQVTSRCSKWSKNAKNDEKVCKMMIKCAKIWESVPKDEKVRESVQKDKIVCKKLRRIITQVPRRCKKWWKNAKNNEKVCKIMKKWEKLKFPVGSSRNELALETSLKSDVNVSIKIDETFSWRKKKWWKMKFFISVETPTAAHIINL